jgi:hypothetical protein
LIVTPVVMLLALALVGYAAYWGYGMLKTGPGPRAADLCVDTPIPDGELTPEYVTVRVFNGGSTGGLAKRTSNYLIAFGFNSIKVNNTEEEIQQTVVVGNDANDPEVQLVLGFFENAIAKGDGRTDHVVDVLVGNAYKAPDKPKVTSVKVKGPVCLPRIITPSATATATPSASPSQKASAKASSKASPSAKASKKPAKKK